MAQTPCATEMTEDQLTWLRNFVQEPVQYRSNDLVHCPLQIHIVGDDNGNGYFSQVNVMRAICKVNQDWLPVGVQFFMHDEFKYINNTDFYIHNNDGGSQMMNQNNVNNTINVYFVEDPNGACGYYSGWRDAIAVSKSCMGSDNNTFAHELGHFFSLPHTFLGWEGDNTPPNHRIERVERTGSNANCSSSGDYFCDTDADYISDRWQCPYNGDLVDPEGIALDVDGSLVMSYSNDVCAQRFSEEQKTAVLGNLYQERSNLINTDIESFELVSSEFIFPTGNATLAPGQIEIIWNESPNAEEYHLNIFSTSMNETIDIYTQESRYTLNLVEEAVYYLRVKPITRGNYCTPYSALTTITATGSNLIQLIDLHASTETCDGILDGQLEFSIIGGSGNYSYSIVNDAGQEVNDLSSLSIGNYTIVVLDEATQETEEFNIYLNGPSPIEATLVQTNLTEIELQGISGGVPPYAHMWNNGSTDDVLYDVSGTQSVTIVDDVFCAQVSELNLWDFTIETTDVLCAGDASGSISIDDISGATAPFEIDWEIESGTSEGLAAGTYSAKIIDANDKIAFIEIEISEPSPLEISVFQLGVQTLVSVTGGVEPYEIIWSTGNSGQSVLDLPEGEYEIHVYDGNNCYQSTVFDTDNLNSNTSVEEIHNGLSLVNNVVPVGGIVQLSNPNNLSLASVQVINLQGQFVHFVDHVVSNLSIDINVPVGTYIILGKNENNNVLLRERIFVH